MPKVYLSSSGHVARCLSLFKLRKLAYWIVRVFPSSVYLGFDRFFVRACITVVGYTLCIALYIYEFLEAFRCTTILWPSLLISFPSPKLGIFCYCGCAVFLSALNSIHDRLLDFCSFSLYLESFPFQFHDVQMKLGSYNFLPHCLPLSDSFYQARQSLALPLV